MIQKHSNRKRIIKKKWRKQKKKKECEKTRQTDGYCKFFFYLSLIAVVISTFWSVASFFRAHFSSHFWISHIHRNACDCLIVHRNKKTLKEYSIKRKTNSNITFHLVSVFATFSNRSRSLRKKKGKKCCFLMLKFGS